MTKQDWENFEFGLWMLLGGILFWVSFLCIWVWWNTNHNKGEWQCSIRKTNLECQKEYDLLPYK